MGILIWFVSALEKTTTVPHAYDPASRNLKSFLTAMLHLTVMLYWQMERQSEGNSSYRGIVGFQLE